MHVTKLNILGIVIGVVLAMLPISFPNAFWHMMMLVDYFYPFIFTSTLVAEYHSFLISRLPDREPLPVLELALQDATKESVYKSTKGYTIPIVIRGAISDLPAVTGSEWTNISWWLENYGDEEVLVCLSHVLYSYFYDILCI